MTDSPLLSVVISYRNWGSRRLRLAVESHLRSALGDRVEVVVSDFGSDAERNAERALSGLPVRVVYNTAEEPWSRGRALNAGAAVARGDYILATDADIVCGPELHGILLAHFEAQPEAVYTFQCRDLDHEFGEERIGRCLENEAGLPLDEMRDHSDWRPRWGMGIAAFRRADFDLIRGYDERFVIWGGEDRDLTNRFSRIGLPVRWIEHDGAEIYHVYHESSQDKAKQSGTGQAAVARNHSYVINDLTVFRNLCSPAYFRSARPLVSVVIATYNRARYIRESVESVLNQTFADLEVLVVDDGSTDETLEVLGGIDDDRLRVIHKGNGGVASARNEAAKQAHGHFIVVHDDDDIMLPDRIESQLTSLTGNKAGSYGGWVDFDDETGRFVQVNPGKDFSAESIAYAGKVLLHPTVMITRRTALEIPYDERYRGGSDFNWMMTIADAGCELVHTGRVHILRRVHGESLTSSGSGQKHASRASVRSLHSGLGCEDVQELREQGKSAPPRDYPQARSVPALYRFLPEPLRRERCRFKLTVDTGDLNRLVKQLRRGATGLVVDRVEPLSVGAVYTPGIWSVEGWAESEEAVTGGLGAIASRCVVERVPGPLAVGPDTSGALVPRDPKSPPSRRLRLAARFPAGTWALLGDIVTHAGTGDDQWFIAARSRSAKKVAVKKADHLVKAAAVGGIRVERLALMHSPEGEIPLYRITGNPEVSGWLERLAGKWALKSIALAFVEPFAMDKPLERG